MYGEVHINRVFYKNAPEPGHRFRQIALHELDQFIVTIGEGDVIRTVPFKAESGDSEAYFHATLQEGINDVEAECQRAREEGWIPYRGM